MPRILIMFGCALINTLNLRTCTLSIMHVIAHIWNDIKNTHELIPSEKKQESRVFASLPIEAVIDQPFKYISCSDPAYPTSLEIFTYVLKQMCSDSKKQQERESLIYIKSIHVCLPLMVLMDSCCSDGWSCFFSESVCPDAFSLKTCALTEISLALCLKVYVYLQFPIQQLSPA